MEKGAKKAHLGQCLQKNSCLNGGLRWNYNNIFLISQRWPSVAPSLQVLVCAWPAVSRTYTEKLFVLEMFAESFLGNQPTSQEQRGNRPTTSVLLPPDPPMASPEHYLRWRNGNRVAADSWAWLSVILSCQREVVPHVGGMQPRWSQRVASGTAMVLKDAETWTGVFWQWAGSAVRCWL